VDKNTFDLSIKNPNKKDETILREPKIILDEMKELNKESEAALKTIRGLL
jgi:type I restriction enzyme M protein